MLILSAVFAVTGTVIAAQEGDYTYTSDGFTATITGYTGAGGAIVIPSTLGGYPTTAIADFAFSNKASLTSVSIPASINYIGGWAFVSCTSLTTVNVPSAVASIGSSTFAYCESLTTVVLTNNLAYIGEFAFFYATSLSSLAMPAELVSVGNYAFAGTSLTLVTLSNKVSFIGNEAFSGITSLTAINVDAANPYFTSVDGILYDEGISTLIQCPAGKTGELTIPSSVTSIGDYAIKSATLTSVIIPESVSSIGMAAFEYCGSMESVNIPNDVTIIRASTFQQCSSLVSITIPDSVTTIASSAFGDCGGLTSVTIGSGIASIGGYAFYNCPSLSSISFTGLIAPTVDDEWLLNSFWAIGHAYAASNFPAPGNDFHGLMMGEVLLVPPTVPGPPTNLMAMEGASQALLSWDPPADNGGSEITGYNLYRSSNGAFSYSLIASPSDPSYLNTNLTKGHTYQYKVSAVNAQGEGANSSLINVTIPNTEFSRHYGQGYSILVPAHWTAEDDANVTGLIINTLLLGPISNGVRTNVIVVTGGDATIVDSQEYLNEALQMTVNGLILAGATNVTFTDTPVYLRISDNSAVVYGIDLTVSGIDMHQETAFIIDAELSVYWYITCTEAQLSRWLFDPTFAVMINEFSTDPLPSVPRNLTADPSNAAVSLVWDEPVANGSTPVYHYNIYRSTTEDGTYSLIASPTGLSYNDDGLDNGQEYWYRIGANNLVGEGELTSPVPCVPFTTPQVPDGVYAYPGNERVTLNWTAPASDGGRAIDYYLIYQNGVVLPDHFTDETALITGLSNGNEYAFSVVAHNSAGNGTFSSPVIVVPFTIPDAPTFAAANAWSSQVILTWSSNGNGSSAITGFKLYRGDSQNGTYLLIAELTDMSFTDSNVSGGHTYWYKVSAVNAAGEGSLSSALSVSAPEFPTILILVAAAVIGVLLMAVLVVMKRRKG